MVNKVEVIKSVRKLPNRAIYGEKAGKYSTSYSLSLNGALFDLNCFTDSGDWIQKIRFSQDGSLLTIWIKEAYFYECKSNIDIVSSLWKAFLENDCADEFPREIRYKLEGDRKIPRKTKDLSNFTE